MVHCGFEPTAVADTVAHPLKALKVFLKGVDTEGPMAPEIDLSKQRPAEYIFEKIVEEQSAPTNSVGEAEVGQRKAG